MSNEHLEKLISKVRERKEKEKAKKEKAEKKNIKKVRLERKIKKLKKEIEERKTPEPSTLKKRAQRLIGAYRHLDKIKGIEDTVDFDSDWMLLNIFSKECIYCGEKDWRLLGCDRINNKKGHTMDNVVPCCKRCNSVRMDKFTVDEMKEIGAVIKRIDGRHKTKTKYYLRKGKPVASFDKDGNKIKEYPCSAQAIEDGYDKRMVRRCASEGRIYKGLYWRYI